LAMTANDDNAMPALHIYDAPGRAASNAEYAGGHSYIRPSCLVGT
jgi:hypothetical protein